jgi:uncharacterized Zn finger protein (UPF0148 family)
VTDQQDDIEDDVDAPKCKACGVPWTRHLGIIAICQQYLETVEELEFVTKERDEARLEWCKLEAKQAITVNRENGLKRRDIGSLEFYMELFAWMKEWDLSKHFKKQNLPKHFYRKDGSLIAMSSSMREVV